MNRILRFLAIALVAACSVPPAPARAGILNKLGWTGAAIAGADVAIIAEATVVAVVAAGTPSYPSAIANLKAKLAEHRIVGIPALGLGVGAALRLYPRMLAAALAVKSDVTDGAGNSPIGSQALKVGAASATGDPNDEDPGQEKTVSVKRPLRAEDLGLKPENVAELRGQVSLDGNTLAVRIDMIRGMGPAQGETLGTSGVTIMRSLQALARENGATTLQIQATLANETLEAVLMRRYGAQMISQNGVEMITMAVK